MGNEWVKIDRTLTPVQRLQLIKTNMELLPGYVRTLKAVDAAYRQISRVLLEMEG